VIADDWLGKTGGELGMRFSNTTSLRSVTVEVEDSLRA